MGLKEGLFTNGCKKTLKLAQNAIKVMYKNEALEEVLLDTFVMIVIYHLVLKEDQKIYKKSSLKSIFINGKYLKI